MQLALIEPPALRVAWPRVRERVAAISARWDEPWLAEDVYAAVLTGNAYLWATPDFATFVVLQVDPMPHGRDLRVWIGSNVAAERPAEFMEQMRAIAAECDCSRVVCESPRRLDLVLPGVETRQLYILKVGD